MTQETKREEQSHEVGVGEGAGGRRREREGGGGGGGRGDKSPVSRMKEGISLQTPLILRTKLSKYLKQHCIHIIYLSLFIDSESEC